MSLLRRFLLRIVCFLRSGSAERELAREIKAHLQLLEDKFVAEGRGREEARFAAQRAFGNVEQAKALQRDARSFRWLSGCLPDLKVGARMLVKYPGLTVVGSLAMAFAIAVGAATFEVIKRATSPDLGLPGGDRIVGFKLLNRAESAAMPVNAYDFLAWRQDLTTVKDLGAFRLAQQNLVAEGQLGEPVTVTRISAAGFRVAAVSPLVGRTLADADEASGAPPVVVLGYDLWRSRFGGNETILGRVVRVGDTAATVVGVMPSGFRFPVDDQLWMPLATTDLSREPGRDPLKVFGRLVPGVTLTEAQAELLTIGARAAAAYPKFYEHLVPQVLPYPEAIIPVSIDLGVRTGLYSVNLLVALFLVVVCGNVALLMFARAAAREKELLVRTALGATPGRIVGMLFIEALVLAIIAVVIGLTAASLLLTGVTEMMRAGPDRWPFWFEGGLSAGTVFYAGLLGLLAAAIAGVVPGVKVMRQGLGDRLRQSSAGAGGLRMGGIWTGVIITQIAATILFTAVALVVQRQAAYLASVEAGFPADKFLSARLEMEPSGADAATAAGQQRFLSRYTAVARELERRLVAQPSIGSVTIADQLPLMPGSMRGLEVESADHAGKSAQGSVRTATVGAGYFEAFQMPVLAGRVFDGRDLEEWSAAVVVNDVFVEQILQGRSAVGLRLRYRAPQPTDGSPPKPGPWLEIVGVVRDLVPSGAAPLNLDNPVKPRVYFPLRAAPELPPLYLAVQSRTTVESLMPMLRRIANEVSPALRLHDLMPLDQATSEDTRFWSAFAQVVLAGSGLTLLLSLAGIYAVMSFTVARRRREIGVRVALGGSARRVILEIFRRPFRQVATGIALGWVLLTVAVLAARGASAESVMKHGPVLIGYGAVMIAACTLACLEPMWRALRVHPIEALRDDG